MKVVRQFQPKGARTPYIKELISFMSFLVLVSALLLNGLSHAHADEGGADTGGGNVWTKTFDEQEMNDALERSRAILPFVVNFIEFMTQPKVYEKDEDLAYKARMSRVHNLLFKQPGNTIREKIKENEAKVKDQCFDKNKKPVAGSNYFLVNDEMVTVPGYFCISFNSIVKSKVDSQDLFVQMLGLSAHEYTHLLAPGMKGIHEIAEHVQLLVLQTPGNLSYRDPFFQMRIDIGELDEELRAYDEGGMVGYLVGSTCSQMSEFQQSATHAMRYSIQDGVNVAATPYNGIQKLQFALVQISMLSFACIQRNGDWTYFHENGDVSTHIVIKEDQSRVSYKQWSQLVPFGELSAELKNEMLIVPLEGDTKSTQEALTNARRLLRLYLHELAETRFISDHEKEYEEWVIQ